MTKAPTPSVKGGEANGQHHAPDFNAIPAELRNARRWLVRRGKIPFYTDGTPRRGELDSPQDTARLASFDEAVAALESGKFDGLGFAVGEGFACIDLDGALNEQDQIIAGHVGEGIAREAQSLGLWMEKSQSGRGLHIFGHAESLSNAVTPGVEFYGDKRFIAMTGETFANPSGWGSLEPLTAMLPKRPEAANDPSEIERFEVDFLESYASPETIEHLRDALRNIPADDRDTWQRMGHALKVLEDKGKELWLEWSATCPEKFDHADALRVWKSFRPTQTGFRAVFAEAARHGWVNPVRKTETNSRRGLRFDRLDELAANPKPLKWAIRGILPIPGLTAIVAPTWGGKSLVRSSFANSISTGRDWFGHRVEQGAFVTISGEGHSGEPLRTLADAINRGINIEGAPQFLSNQAVQLLSDAEFHDELIPKLDAIHEQQPIKCIAIDTFARASGGIDENSSKDMGELITRCDALIARYRCAVIAVHHTGHSNQNRARGSTAFTAAMDSEILIEKNPDGTRTLHCNKLKDGSPFEPITFSLKTIQLPHTDFETGQPMESVALERLNPLPDELPKPLGKWQHAAFDALEGILMFEDSTTRDEVVALAMKSHPPKAGARDRRRELLIRAVDELVEKGAVSEIDGHLCFVGQGGR